MASPDEMQAANDDSLSRDAGIALRLLHWFLESRQEALAELIGPGYHPDPVRDDLMRVICLFFARGEVRTLSEYQRDLAHADGPAVAAALRSLEAAQLVVTDGREASAGSIRPTRRLVGFYNKVMPEVLDVARRIVRDEPLSGPQEVAYPAASDALP